MIAEFVAERHSDFFRRSLVAWRHRARPGWNPDERLTADVEQVIDAGRIAAWFDELLQTDGQPTLTAAHVGQTLRRLRNWLMLCLIERDLSGRADLAEVCTAMTALAEFASQQALDVLAQELVARHGVPHDSQGSAIDLMIIAMGKAGGGELNVSSDLDVVFVVRDEGETRPIGAVQPGLRIQSGSEFFHQLARQWVALMSNNDEAGFVFRVDTRLRPDGDSGPLVVTLPMLEHYFFGQAREWERFAWLKSRCIATTRLALEQTRHQDQEALDGIVRPFVFRRYHDFNAFNALRDLHLKIRSEMGKRDVRREGSYDVKLGRGGIREIEFVAQLFQIVRGGRDNQLRSRRTLDTLNSLAEKHLLEADDANQLKTAYELLRRTEHALQYREDAQTHRLPLAGAARDTIALMLRLSPAEFDEQLAACTQAVQRVFDQLLTREPAEAKGDTTGPPSVDTPAAEPEVIDPELQARITSLFASNRFLSSRSETQQAVNELLARAHAAQTPSVGIRRLIDLIETVIGRPAYLTLLARYPRAFTRVLDMISKAQWASDYLNRHPIVLDELLDGQLLEPVDYRQWRINLAQQLSQAQHDGHPDIERQMDLMRESHHAQEFRLLAQDIAGLLSVERLSDFLSELADQVLTLTLATLWPQIPGRFREHPRFAIIAYGKLGGKELGYASDLDLVFLYDDDDERAPEVYSRLAQRLSGWLSRRTAAGILFEIDLRLRPNGNAGLLVTTVEAFNDYQRESAWVWEHQALTRARFAAGDAGIGARFETIRQDIIAREREPLALAREVRAMRQKMLDGHPNRTAEFDLKHDRGGMVDIEFIVQYLVLAHGHRYPELCVDAGNIALLLRASERGLIDAELAKQTADIYRRYRQQQHLLRLNGAAYSRVPPEQMAGEREAVLRLWRLTLGDEPM